MWERTLQDLIRGLRAHKNSSKAELDSFLDEAIREIKLELKGKDMELKAAGVVKLCYLMMLHPIAPPPSFAFHVVEGLEAKQHIVILVNIELGYVAAPLAFSLDTEEVVLTVNGIRKDLMASHPHLPPLALMGLSDIMTPALARDVYADVASLTTHSKAHVRKRAVLALFRVFERYPDAMRVGFVRLRDRLEDDDPGVVSATVNVITELSRKSNPQNFLPLAPVLFELLTTSSNNWMLIKIIKLFATLTSIEPRLVRKLLPPITNLISTTPAISLLYECVRTCIIGGMLAGQTEAADALARVCLEKLSAFLGDEDQNLKYIALLAMVKIVPTHQHLMADYQEEILQSLDDEDISIRMRALELTSNMVTRHNIRDVVTQLMSYLVPGGSDLVEHGDAAKSLVSAIKGESSARGVSIASLTPAYRLELVHRILSMTSHDAYVHITDFEWYFSVLVDLAYVAEVPVGIEIRNSMLDVAARVEELRSYAVDLCRKLLRDGGFVEPPKSDSRCPEVIYAAAWICGEYSNIDISLVVIDELLHGVERGHSSTTTAVLLTAATKVFGRWIADAALNWAHQSYSRGLRLIDRFLSSLDPLTRSSELVVSQRASNFIHIFTLIRNDLEQKNSSENRKEDKEDMNVSVERVIDVQPDYPKSAYLLLPLFAAYELNPVEYKAQERVEVPDSLDLSKPFVDPETLPTLTGHPVSEDEKELEPTFGMSHNMEDLQRALKKEAIAAKRAKKQGTNPNGKEAKEERAARRAAKHRRLDPLKSESSAIDVDDIPIVKLNLSSPGELSPSSRSSQLRDQDRIPTQKANANRASPGDTFLEGDESTREEGILGIDSQERDLPGISSQSSIKATGQPEPEVEVQVVTKKKKKKQRSTKPATADC